VDVELPVQDRMLHILKDIDFDCAPGEIVGIVGPSGTGKTTLLKLLGGLLKPSKGEVLLQGEPVKQPTGVAITVFQDYGQALLPWRTVAKNVSLGLEGRVSRAERNERIHKSLEMVGLDHRADDYPWRLSGGMQQRVQIARALAVEPQVLLMDEPFGALDAMTKATLQDQLLEVKIKTDSTIIFITHDVEEAVYLADRVMVIHGTPGQIIETVSTDLPRPRDQLATRELPRYLEVRHHIGELLRHGVSK
jgi:NitT/TauT family transport system ATP-binding protein